MTISSISRIPLSPFLHDLQISPLRAGLIDILFLLATGFVAYHGITYRDERGEQDWVRLLFGCIALIYFMLVLFSDVLGLIRFG